MDMSVRKVKKPRKKKAKPLKNTNTGDDGTAPSSKVEDKSSKKKKRSKKSAADHVHETVAQNKALRYLQLWHSQKKGVSDEPWKFEKCRQIWLLQNCYDETRVPDREF